MSYELIESMVHLSEMERKKGSKVDNISQTESFGRGCVCLCVCFNYYCYSSILIKKKSSEKMELSCTRKGTTRKSKILNIFHWCMKMVGYDPLHIQLIDKKNERIE